MDMASTRMMALGGQGFCCSQIMVLLALETQGLENPPLVRALSGLCNGISECEGPCGVLTGGACLLGLYAGKGDENEEVSERLPLMLQTLYQWFRETIGRRHGGIRCCDILGKDACEGPNWERCGTIVADTYAHCLESLMENGFDPSIAPGMGAI